MLLGQIGARGPKEGIRPLTSKVACVDFSVAKDGGKMIAYRYDGEVIFDAGKFVAV
jgi:hypothetical protein